MGLIILAAIAIPNLLRARLNANEAAAQSTIKTISTAVESFRAAQTTPTYPAVDSTDTGVTGLTNVTPAYVDAGIFAAAGRQGYVFVYRPTLVGAVAQRYVATATPVTDNVTGSRRFAVNETGVLKAAASPTAVPGDSAGYNAWGEVVQ
ncbi:MAG: hypothetical protein KKA28_19920 [Planctomycetes bacterium]|nr:hypothetical protein [Planctomycetota bacterium]